MGPTPAPTVVCYASRVSAKLSFKRKLSFALLKGLSSSFMGDKNAEMGPPNVLNHTWKTRKEKEVSPALEFCMSI